MGRALQSKGGRGREKLVNKWKYSSWKIENEVVKPVNNRKRKATTIMQKLECNLKESNKKLKEMFNQITNLKNSAKKIAKSVKYSPTIEPRKRKKISDCSPQYQCKKKRKLIGMFKLLFQC